LYTKASWERIGGYWEYGRGLHEAWGFTLKQLASGNTMYVVPDTYYFHRHGHESLFVSESKNKAGETALVHQMIAPYQNIFAPSSFELLQSDTNWYRALDSHPLKLNSEPLGKNGTLVITGYGRLFSIKRKVISLFT
jgi:hypothetical protein